MIGPGNGPSTRLCSAPGDTTNQGFVRGQVNDFATAWKLKKHPTPYKSEIKRPTFRIPPNLLNQTVRNLVGLICMCFLKKLLKWVASVYPKTYAMSATVKLLVRKRIFASCRMRSEITCVVVLFRVTFIALFKWLTWMFRLSANWEAERRRIGCCSTIGNCCSSSSKKAAEIRCDAFITWFSYTGWISIPLWTIRVNSIAF